MKVELTLRAIFDLKDIYEYLSTRDPRATDGHEQAFRTAFEVLSAHPRTGRSLRSGVRRFTVARCPYLIFYRIDEAASRIEVVTIRHAARAPQRWSN